MTFLILTKFGEYKIEAEDFEEAVQTCYDTHRGYDDVMAIVKAEEED